MTVEGRNCDVLIAGGGPSGLVLGIFLAQAGIDVVILESHNAPKAHSRAIGLHPPALAVLNRLGLEETATAEGISVRAGVALCQGATIGMLPFEHASPLRPFVLTLPQNRTETLLRERLRQLAPQALNTGWQVVDVTRSDNPIQVTARGPSPKGTERTSIWQAGLLVGADGAHSIVRERMNVPTNARLLPDTYMMGDFPDLTDHGDIAAIYLEPDGVVESFPLSDSRRRWVAHTGSTIMEPSSVDLAAIVEQRTGETPDPEAASMTSSFTVRRRIVERMLDRQQVLIGDAAHEISPIGGQGMTLGWLDAAALAPLLIMWIRGECSFPLTELPDFRQFERTRLRAARAAARQAEMNMILGRPRTVPLKQMRNAALSVVLRTPLRNQLAKRFTMRTI